MFANLAESVKTCPEKLSVRKMSACSYSTSVCSFNNYLLVGYLVAPKSSTMTRTTKNYKVQRIWNYRKEKKLKKFWQPNLLQEILVLKYWNWFSDTETFKINQKQLMWSWKWVRKVYISVSVEYRVDIPSSFSKSQS